MPTVYAVTSGSYSDYRVHAVYSTKEKAEEAINLAETSQWMQYDIEERELDPPINTNPSTLRRYYVNLYISKVAGVSDRTETSASHVGLGGWGEDVTDAGENYLFFPWHDSYSSSVVRLFGYRFLCTVVSDDEEQAIKVANERRIMAVANGELAAWEKRVGINRP